MRRYQPKVSRVRGKGERDLVKPTLERFRHDHVGVPVYRLEETIADVEGGIGRPFKALSTLEVMSRHGTVTLQQQRAGEAFHASFIVAGLEPLFASDPTRIPVKLSASYGRQPHGSERARQQIREALAVLGGAETVGGSCAWHVLGRELSLREWSVHRGWNRRPVQFAAGILVYTLDLLRSHYGY